ncbi:hypothetical protein PVMG_05181 [Plasmodium vivax Mauritania I]|uniref:Liprin-beta-1/2 coiled-coil domain-containing protein n=1 Tax=Plasmodium vivax Mauritania I TaxID=1035515 RepID=A0A0J9TJE3_PLAVI|nr:hypothetical protein PVMG_05181 [Plasmodium vivax Mauritania I]
MGKSRKLKNLVKNVQFFVKKCREKNKKLLSLSSLDEKDETLNSGIFTDEKTNGSKSFKENSAENISKASSESKYDPTHADFASAYGNPLRRSHTQGNLHTLSDYFDRRSGKKIVKLGKDGGKRETIGGSMDEAASLNEEEVRTEKSDSSSVEIKRKKQPKDSRMEEMKNEIMEYDLHLLSLYKKLEKGSRSGPKRSGGKGSGKASGKGGGKGSATLNGKAHTIKTYNSEVMSIKKEISLRSGTSKGKTRKGARGKDEAKDKGGIGGGKRKGESPKEHTSRGVKKKAHEERIEIKHSFSGDTPRFDSKSSFLTREETFPKYYQIGSSKKTFDNFYFFQEGLANRLNKKQNTSSFDIGCMYMSHAISTKSSKDLGPKEEATTTAVATRTAAATTAAATIATAGAAFISSSKSLRRFKFLSDNKKNIEYYKQMIESLEGTVGKSKKRSNNSSSTGSARGGNRGGTHGGSSIDSIIKIINCLLHDYVPKLIDRYEYYLNTLDDRNKLLKQKIRESLDFGDLQYEEIRELKSQVMQKNQENKKLNDTIEMLKDKLSYVNELELKNAEYLDEIMLMRNRVTYLERLIEENDQSKESHELRKMRHNLRRLYNRMKTEMRYMKTLKSRSFKRHRRGKFSIRRWMRLEEKMSEQQARAFSLDRQGDSTLEVGDKGERRVTLEVADAGGTQTNEPKQYADKGVDTSDMYWAANPLDVVSSEAQCAPTGEGEKVKKGKVRTKDKKINTIVSNRTFLELLRREERMAVGGSGALGRGNIVSRGGRMGRSDQGDRGDRSDRSNLNGRNGRSGLRFGSERCTRIPKESYPYYHYFYSNMLATPEGRPLVGGSRIWPPTQGEKEPSGIFPPRVTLSEENYLSLCSQLKACIYQTYFEECAAEPRDGGQPWERTPHRCEAPPDQGKQHGENEAYQQGGNRGTENEENRGAQNGQNGGAQNDQPRGGSQMVMPPQGKSPFWKETPPSDDASTHLISRGKNKCYKLPFDCCSNFNRMLTGEMNCSSLLWGCSNAAGSQDSSVSNRKRAGRKRSTTSSSSSWERKDKLKMTRVVRKNHPFLRSDTIRSKCKHRYYYYNRVGRAANGEGPEGEANQMASCTSGKDHHRGEQQNGRTCLEVPKGGDAYELHTPQKWNKESDAYELHTPQKWNKGVDLGGKTLMDSEPYGRSTYDKERVENFKKFLTIYNSHFEGDKKGSFIGSFKREQSGPSSERAMWDQAVQAQVGGEEEGRAYHGDYQISSHYNCCRVDPPYSLPHVPPRLLPPNGAPPTGNETVRYQNSLNQFFDINTKDFEAINRYLHGHVVYTHAGGGTYE